MAGKKLNRRSALKNISLGIGAISFGGLAMTPEVREESSGIFLHSGKGLKGNIHHAVCRWCYRDMPLREFAEAAKAMGIKAIDLLRPEEWKVVQKAGLECSLATDTFASITDGFNDPGNHEALQTKYHRLITEAAEAGIQQVIVFSGNRRGMSDETGLEHCARGLDKLVKQAEKNKITLVMELLNSKVDHADYQCDRTPWGVALVDKIGSPHFKLLYDIYHMQIMEGDVIATIRKYKDYMAHYHTAGVPGRHEINDSQELNYPAIMRAIAGTGFKGYVAQEFIPTYENKLEALQEGIMICDV